MGLRIVVAADIADDGYKEILAEDLESVERVDEVIGVAHDSLFRGRLVPSNSAQVPPSGQWLKGKGPVQRVARKRPECGFGSTTFLVPKAAVLETHKSCE
ncbi:hypothetical protein [Ancrocorticia populi]|uniref:hypothetical protein n=1 Tax=Ancrocorticia populi TaxID=2175228 RepID=UPI001A9C774B|nr:hypothetical protein [Ancrocorticia populi]